MNRFSTMPAISAFAPIAIANTWSVELPAVSIAGVVNAVDVVLWTSTVVPSMLSRTTYSAAQINDLVKIARALIVRFVWLSDLGIAKGFRLLHVLARQPRRRFR